MGLYSSLEYQWYNLIDGINDYIPVAGLVDRIDSLVPSFLLFIFVIILIVAGAGFYFYSGSALEKNVKITVTDVENNLISGALITVNQTCESVDKETSLVTDSSGSAKFMPCGKNALLEVSKEGFLVNTMEIKIPQDSKVIIKLAKQTMKVVKANVKIVDEKEIILSKAKLELICIKGTEITNTLITGINDSEIQPVEGYFVDYNGVCDVMKLSATAPEYNDKQITLEENDTNRKIMLERLILKGTVIFTADSPNGKQAGTEITITDSFGLSQTLKTLLEGEVSAELDEGEYNYSAEVKGFVKTGTFEIIGNQITEKTIYFLEIPADINRNIDLGLTKQIYIKLVGKAPDTNALLDPAFLITANPDVNMPPVTMSEMRIFCQKDGDTNFFKTVTSGLEGVFGPVLISDLNGKNFVGVIKAQGYMTRIVGLDQKSKTDSAQIVEMTQGGSTLTVNIYDDLNKPILGAVTKIFFSGFDPELESARPTDINGKIIYHGLMNGTYKIISKTAFDDGGTFVSINGQDKEITLNLVAGTGSIRFEFSTGTQVSSINEVQQKNGNDFNKINAIQSKNYTITSIIKANSLVRVLVDDKNYYPYESLLYLIKRDQQDRKIYLRNVGDLPNSNEIQMVLRKILTSDPTVSKEAVASKVMPGQRYYFLYDLILTSNDSTLNTGDEGTVVVNAFASQETTEGLRGMLIQGAKSINGSAFIMTNKKQGFLITGDSVDADANQVNILINGQYSPKVIPVLLEVSVDVNAQGSQKINWQVKYNSKQSLEYSKELTVGESICFDDCPKILFSSYLNWNSGGWKPLDDSIHRIQMGDNYEMKVIAHNLTDTDLGTAALSLNIDSSAKTKLAFVKDKNVILQNVQLSPLKTTPELIGTLQQKQAATSFINIYQSLRDPNASANNDKFKAMEGNDKKIRFDLKNKGDLNIEIYAGEIKNTITENSYYPIIMIRTISMDPVTKLSKPISAYWKATIQGQSMPFISNHQTDGNGTEFWYLDATSFHIGDNIIFEAWDELNSNPTKLVIPITNPFNLAAEAPGCITVRLNDGRDVKLLDNPTMDLDIDKKGFIIVDSNCAENRTVLIYSDLFTTYDGGLSARSITLAPGARKTIEIDGSDTVIQKGGMLGVYPLQIFSATGQSYKQVQLIDVILKDPNSQFELNTAIFDLRKVNSLKGIVKNKSFAGRKDVFYPQMELSNDAVGIDYYKPGIPEKINFTVNVKTVGIEGVTYGYLVSQPFEINYASPVTPGTTPVLPSGPPKFSMTYKGESCIPVVAGSSGPASSSGTTPNPTYEFFFDNVGYSVCNDVINKILYTKSVNKVAPYSSLRDPSKPFFTLPLEDRLAQISQIRSQTGSVSSISSGTIYSEGENNTIPSIHFSLPSTTPKGNMGRQTAGDIYSYTPPNLLKTTPDGNVSVFARLAVGTDPLPVDYNYDVWNTILDDTSGRLYVCSTGNTKFNTFGYYGNGMLGGFITAGTSGTASNYQSELIRVITPLNERTSLFTQTYEMNPIEEGRVIDLGPYTYNVDPKWNVSNAGKLYDLYKTGDTWDISLSKYCNKSYDILSCKNDKGDYSSVYLKGTPEYTTNEFSPYCVKQKSLAPSCYYAARNATSINASTNVAKAKALCSSTEGLVPFELAKKDGVPYPAPDANIPFVEYHRDGKTYSIIDPASFPEGVRLFLKDGRIYAEYIGLYKTDSNGSVYFLPTENASPDINFTISRNSVAGTSYAILTVRDWINGSQKAEKKFQVKILGNETNCISPDGEEGLTGKSANLRLYYNWDWQTIQENQCDSSNINYTYCDATQYTISLFKKLKKIQDALLMSDPAQVSRYSTFFSYLLKDSYSQDFLNAFDNYYSSQLFVSDYFNTTEEKNGLDLLINSGRIRFLVRGDNGILYETGVLPYSGVYRTEITIYYDNPTEQQLILPDGSPGAIITITFIPYKQTGNQNPLYETPFDGKVGYTVGTDGIEKSVRGNYGTGYVGELLLNSKGEKALPADNALMNITGQTANDLVTLDKGTVLSYNGKTLKFTPSQPTPVLMKIEGTGGPVNAAYEYVYGTDKGTSLKKTWRMRASTIGTGCMDFNGKKQLSFLENIPSPRIRSLNWAMTPQNSSISLVTTYYTSRTGPVEAIAIKPVDPLSVSFFSVLGVDLKNATTIWLKYYDAETQSALKDYDSLQGIMDKIDNEQLCISKTPKSGQIRIWWNPVYISKIENSVPIDEGNYCVR